MAARSILVLIAGICLYGETLEQRLKETASRLPAQVSLYAKNLDTGKDVGLQPDTPVRTASTIKLAIMVGTFAEVNAGRAQWTDLLPLTDASKVSGSGILREFSSGLNVPLRDCVHLMIVVSDNTATNMVLDRIKADTVNQWMDEFGFPKTRSMRKILGASEAGHSKAGLLPENKKYGLGVSTPREMVGILEKLERGELVSPAASKEMIAILKRQQDHAGISRHTRGIPVASKAGALDALRSDVGIVYTKSGRIAIAITVDGMARPEWSPDNPGLLLISDLTQVILENLGS